MTNDDKKKKLRAYLDADEKISDILSEIADLKIKSTKVTSTLSDMPKGSGASDKTKIIDRYLDMANDLKLEMSDLKNKKRDVEYLISTIDDWKIERVMRLRYIRGLQWEEICHETSYCWTQVHKHHSDGLGFIEFER